MAAVLRLLADAGPVDGLPAWRHVALESGATGWDVRFLLRVVEVLRPMPRVQSAFDAGLLSWSQVRGIAKAAERLGVADPEQGGPTETANLVGLCRRCHMALDRHGWQMQMDPDGTLHTRIGRRWYTTRPRLRPP